MTNVLSIDELRELIARPLTDEDIKAFKERVKKREEEFKKSPGAHHFNYDRKYRSCD
jgi:hypothetical protein